MFGQSESTDAKPEQQIHRRQETHTQIALPESMSHLKAGHQCPRNNVSFTSSLLLLLVLGGNVPVCQPFGGFNSNSLNLRLRSCRMITTSCLTAAVAPRRRRRPRSCSGLSPLFLAAAAEAATPGEENNGHGGDVIAGSKQLESWKTSTARGSSSTSTGTSSTPALAPKRSNVMGRIKEAAEATIIRSVEGSGGSDAEAEPLPPLSPPPPPPPRLQRGGGGAVHGEASPVWRVEATTTSEELLSCFKVRVIGSYRQQRPNMTHAHNNKRHPVRYSQSVRQSVSQ